MADCKPLHIDDVYSRMEGDTGCTHRKERPQAHLTASFKLATSISDLDDHQELYQRYLNKIIQSASKSQDGPVVKFEGEKGASINFKLLLEHAMAGMKRDHDSFAVENSYEGHERHAVDGSRLKNAVLLRHPQSRLTSRDSKRPPVKTTGSLAAAHPASYSSSTTHHQKTELTSPPRKCIKLEPVIKVESNSASKPRPVPACPEPRPLCAQIHDPKFLTGEQLIDRPMYKHLSRDTDPRAPVISPTFMIALPLGTLVEGATYWPGMEFESKE